MSSAILEPSGIQSLLSRSKGEGIVITTHHKPDADALGSSLGLHRLLTNMGHAVQVISPTDYPFFLDWMPGQGSVINFEERPDDARVLIEQAAIIFCLDFNDPARINDMGKLVSESSAAKILIDHHRNPVDFAQYRYWTLNTSSTSELIYNLANDCGWLRYLDAEAAGCLYAGIMTDTGSFRFSTTSSQTHRIIADLIDKGAQHSNIHELLFDNYTLMRYRMMGYVLYEKLEILPEFRTALIYLNRDELQRFDVQTGDTEGFVNFGLGIKDVVLSVLIIDRTKLVKMSFRSKGNFPCNEMASTHFDGGGHLNASGGSSTDTLEATVEKFKRILPEYKSALLAQ